MDDFVVNVRQIQQYPPKNLIGPTDTLLFQSQLGGPYGSVAAADLVSSALASGGWLLLATHFGINWGDRGTFWYDPGSFQFSDLVTAPSFNATTGGLFDNGKRVATEEQLAFLVANQVLSVNGRTGHVQIETDDIMRAGAAPIDSPHFSGWVTAPTVWDLRRNDDTVATTAWVQQLLVSQFQGLLTTGVVASFNGRVGAVTLTTADVNAAYATVDGTWPTAPNPALGDASNRIATTAFVDESLADFSDTLAVLIQQASAVNLAGYAPLASPAFSGVPTAPTAAVGNSTGQLATTAFVAAAISAGVAGVASFNTRTGAVVLLAADVTAAGGALLASPTFTGAPAAPTAAPGDNTTKLATTAFVHAAVAAVNLGVTSFNTRTGSVVLTTADITGAGGAALASPTFTGVPAAPTASLGTNTTQLATTAFVAAALAGSVAGVASFNGRSGAVTLQANDVSAVGGALLAGPTFTGVPSAPTAVAGTSTTQLATCAFVTAAISAGNVASFNGRTGAVVLLTADITGAGGAPINSPAFTGVPTANTASQTVNDTTIATTAFVHSAVSVSGGVASFNTRTGAVTLAAADVTGVGGALLAGPTFTGIPAAPTAAPGSSTTQLATTAFVTAAVNASVVSFNGRTGAVTFQANDISAVGGALLASPTFTGSPLAPTQTTGTNNTTLATTAFVQNAISSAGGVTTFNTRAGAVTFLASDITGVGGALLASPTFTGTPAAPTAAPLTNTTQLATCAFVQSVLGSYAPLSSPNLTGTPTAPTAAALTNNTQIATTAFVLANSAPLANPNFTGTPTAPTAAPNTSTTQLATTAFVMGQLSSTLPLMSGVAAVGTGTTFARADHVHPINTTLAPLASPALTGTPTAPTAAAHTNNTQVASTAYVDAAVAAVGGTPIRYFGGTINPTALVPTISSVVSTTGVITYGSAHGLTTGNVYYGTLNGTPPPWLTVNQGYYIRALSATTLALYLLLADAKADANRLTNATGTGTSWNIRQFLYQNVLQSGFDTQVPIGFWAAHGVILPELNLATALAGLFAIVSIVRINSMFDNGATPAQRAGWYSGAAPTVVSTTLVRLDNTSWAFSSIAATVTLPGTWASQLSTPFYFELMVIG